jgi:pyruvate formate lyase activating enzyme
MCVIPDGHAGECRIRVNLDGKLLAVTHSRPCAVHIDPVEKKPLYHFLPGTGTFSIATVGCNLHCKNCQNWQISQAEPGKTEAYLLPPENLCDLAKKESCPSISYTYTEPLVYYEYTLESCIKAREAGLKNILVTAAYLNPEPLKELFAHVDAANIDLKSMSDDFYRDICGATLKPVLVAISLARSMGIMVEITNLLIPTLNDSETEIKQLTVWVKENLGADTPLHFSRFFPHYRMQNLPATPEQTLIKAREIAYAAGLKHVYIGNLSTEGNNTICPKCGKRLIYRQGYRIMENNILATGRCRFCQQEIHGVWN